MTNRFLVVGAILSGLAGLLHVGCVIFGAPWYRFFGAGEEMARMAETGRWMPGLLTSGIAGILGVWALYALSGAGIIRKLPWLRTMLCVISSVYLARGLVAIPIAIVQPQQSTSFLWWSSSICVGFGLVHVIGIYQGWQAMAVPNNSLQRTG